GSRGDRPGNGIRRRARRVLILVGFPGIPVVAQSVAQLSCKQQVTSSSLVASSLTTALSWAAHEGWPGSGLPQAHDPPACPVEVTPQRVSKTGRGVRR